MKTKKGFTLVELLVVISIIAVLLAVLMPSLQKARELAKRTICATQVKQTGVGMAGYAMMYDDKMPYSGGYTSVNGKYVPDDTKDEPTPHYALIWRTGHDNDKDTPFQDPDALCVCGLPGKARPMRIACLFAAKLIQDGKIFYCPANTVASRRYDSYTYSKKPLSNEWGRPHQVFSEKTDNPGWIRSGYDYYAIDRNIKKIPPSYPGMERISNYYVPKITCRKFSNLSAQAPYLTDVIQDPTAVTHKSGLRKVGTTERAKGAGINSLFRDNSVKFVRDTTCNSNFSAASNDKETLFDNAIWPFAPGITERDEVKGQVFYYYMFDLIGKCR
jgi:prepilin-type N-terminal cleavage/methylation domain-containing protein